MDETVDARIRIGQEERAIEEFEIRRGDQSDLATLVALAEEFVPRETDAESRSSVLRQSLKELDYELLVADAGGKITGFIDRWIINDFVRGAKLAYIQNLYVSPNYRRKGIGSRLLQETVKRAKDKGVIEIHVSTEFDNKGAIEFYRKQGFPEEHLQFEKEL